MPSALQGACSALHPGFSPHMRGSAALECTLSILSPPQALLSAWIPRAMGTLTSAGSRSTNPSSGASQALLSLSLWCVPCTWCHLCAPLAAGGGGQVGSPAAGMVVSSEMCQVAVCRLPGLGLYCSPLNWHGDGGVRSKMAMAVSPCLRLPVSLSLSLHLISPSLVSYL